MSGTCFVILKMRGIGGSDTPGAEGFERTMLAYSFKQALHLREGLLLLGPKFCEMDPFFKDGSLFQIPCMDIHEHL